MRINEIRRKIKHSNLGKQLLFSSSWVFISSIIAKGSLLFATILVAKYVNKEVYGEFGIIKSTVNMFTVFGAMGLGATATKFIAQYKEIDVDKTAKIISISNLFSIIFSIIIASLIVTFAKNIANFINAPHLYSAVQVSSLMILFSALNGVQNGILAGFENFKAISINSVIAAIISTIFQILGAFYYGLIGVIVGFGLNYLLLFVLNWSSIRRLTYGKFKVSLFSNIDFKEANILWTFSLPAVLSSIMVSPVVWFTNSILVNNENGFAQMAVFDIANQWRTTILFFPTILSQILFPIFAKNAANTNYHHKLFKLSITINFVTSGICVFLLLPLSKFILTFYGDSYLDGLATFNIMLFTTILVAINNVIGQIIASKDRMWIGFFTNFFWGAVLIFSTYYFVSIKQMGSFGLGLSYLISYTFHSIIQYIIYIKVLYNKYLWIK